MSIHRNSPKRPRVWGCFILLGIGIGILIGTIWLRPWESTGQGNQLLRLRSWLAGPSAHIEWSLEGQTRCPSAPMILPTSGYIGYGRGDSFYPGHQHSGFDIFSPDGKENVTPIYAAYPGYLTRESDWFSTVIIRHPNFAELPEIVGGKQIWTYYTHMAASDGTKSYISSEFPPNTHEVYVAGGTLLGYQGAWSGDASSPTGLHLHFSIVKSKQDGSYANESIIENTYDPAPFLGVQKNESGIWECGNELPVAQ